MAHDEQWQIFISDVAKLCDLVEKYAKYLENVNQRMRHIYANSLLAHNEINDIKVEDIEASLNVASEYEEVSYLMQKTELYVPICLNEFIPKNKIERFGFLISFS